MKGRRIRGICCLFLIILVANLFMPSTGWALSCAELVSAEKEYEQSDVVFKGTVKKHRQSTFVMQVHSVYKGETSARTVVKDITGDWLQETLKEGSTYLVYGQKDGNRVEVSPCGRTDYWDEVKADLEQFPAVEELNYRMSDYKEATLYHRLKIIGIIVGVGVVITGVWWFRKQRMMKR